MSARPVLCGYGFHESFKRNSSCSRTSGARPPWHSPSARFRLSKCILVGCANCLLYKHNHDWTVFFAAKAISCSGSQAALMRNGMLSHLPSLASRVSALSLRWVLVALLKTSHKRFPLTRRTLRVSAFVASLDTLRHGSSSPSMITSRIAATNSPDSQRSAVNSHSHHNRKTPRPDFSLRA